LLGERLLMSLPAAALPEPVIHTPLIVQMSSAESGTRRQTLVQTVDLMPTLLDWFGVTSPGRQCEGRSLIPLVSIAETEDREYLCLGDSAGATAIRTRNRHLVRPVGELLGEDLSRQRMYVKPDDVWDVHDVAAQSPDETESLSSTLDQFIRRARASVPLEPPMLR
jgi:arylsulfatase A-like enzyme